ncbi:MAG: response regulator [Chitinivibrionales bacterium]
MENRKTPVILIIDDDEFIRSNFSSYLNDCGFETINAGTGEKGIELYKKSDPDCVIIDLQMPGMNGHEVIRSLSSKSRTLPIIVVSGTGNIMDPIGAVREGAWDYIIKPLSDLSILNHRITSSIERRRLMQENIRYQEHLEHMVEERTKELKKSEKRFRDLAELLPEALFEVDIEMKVTYTNKTGLFMFGYSEEDIKKGLTPYDVISPKDHGQITEGFYRQLSGTRREAAEYTGVRKDGTTFPILFHANVININGEITGLRGIIIDITERKKFQEQLSRSERLEATGQLAGGIAHDFNNMLGGIINMSELLKQNFDNPLRRNEYLEMILETASRASDLTTNMLTFARQDTIRKKPCSINKAINQAIDLLEHSIDKRVDIRKNLNAESTIVKGDISQLQNMLLNLGINSSHAIDKNGIIEFSTGTVELSSTYCTKSGFDLKPGKHIRIDVKDNGCGIAPEHTDHIFEPFFTTKEKGKGTGLGLSAVYGIVKSHYGEINLESSSGEGTLFSIHLPVSEESIESGDRENFTPAYGHGRILVADDDRVIRRAAVLILEKYGYSIVTAEDGNETLEIFKKENKDLDLVVMDIQMPGKDGKECFFRMKEIDPEVKVILSSGYSRNEDIQELTDKGLQGFIHKPYRSHELTRIVAEALG